MNRHILVCLIFALVLAGAAQAQIAAEPEPAFGPELPYTEVLTPPMPVSAKSVPLTFSSENARSNFLTGGLQLGVGFDDNALSTSDHQVSDISYLVLPHIEIGQTRERWKWDLAYNPGFTVNQRFSQRNQTAQNLNFALDYRLSPHVALQLSDNFDKTNNLFSGLLGNPLAPGPGPIQQPNLIKLIAQASFQVL